MKLLEKLGEDTTMKLLEKLGFPSQHEMETHHAQTATLKAPKLPVRRPVTPSLSVDELAEYARVAKAIALEPGIVLKERIRRCLLDNAIREYDSDQVYAFLDAKLGKGKWVWAGLRDSDVKHLKGWWATHGDGRVDFADKRYRLAVPLPVLLTVETILKDIPEAHFYVSQSADENADPFLNVTGRSICDFIVERWDEPNYRERSK